MMGDSHCFDPINMQHILGTTAVMPIVWIHERATAVDVAHALVAGGCTVFEVLLRTPQALDAVSDMRRHVPEAVVGAGTLLSGADAQRAKDAGAMFGVSPGLSDDLADGARRSGLPLLPGVFTASEIMQALRLGFDTVKLFPAYGLHGITHIEQLQGVFQTLRFCPTGGIKPEHIPAYLKLPSVGCVGGSWVTPPERVAARDFAAITALAKQAAAFASMRAMDTRRAP